MRFVYAGENERLVRALNFQPIKEGGLGLIHPGIKSKVFLIKSMNKDFDDVGREGRNVKKLRGWVKEFQFIHDLNILDSDNKTIYSTLLEKTVKKNGSLIPSRNEKRTRGVKWKVTWRNLTLLRNVNPYEKCFGWKMTQDLVEVGARLHRNGAVSEPYSACSRAVRGLFQSQ